ncbi:hypothetical protein SmJEL517_g01575 [Synchytrium microbalum]|uniref:AMP-dependent synthetase/ligase domain-containing protein n=1 Tax=Synchytrium microbalum TaxID=1806994 RepID=A0A507C486_9FUNG|nr:uncharacterized protein SmJEL517_g01575 [Synchytrium microbalum]TPX36350.1 hypothetical protein SmJEL517_g01575 [Synchytrium microbalum]
MSLQEVATKLRDLYGSAEVLNQEAKEAIISDLTVIGQSMNNANQLAYRFANNAWNMSSLVEEHANNNNLCWRDCLVFEDVKWTWIEFNRDVNKMANWLISVGVKRLDHVCLIMENAPQFLLTWMACGRIGAAASFINFNLKGRNLEHCVNLSEARIIVVDSIFSANVKEIESTIKSGHAGENLRVFEWGTGSKSLYPQVNFITLNKVSDHTPANAYGGKDGTPDDTCMLIFTSGTTGLPKSVRLSHGKQLATGMLISNSFQMNSSDRCYSALPLYHGAATMVGWCGMLSVGGCFCLARKFSASGFFVEGTAFLLRFGWSEPVTSLYSWKNERDHGDRSLDWFHQRFRYLLQQPVRPTDKAHRLRIALGVGLRPDIWNEFKTRFNIRQIGEWFGQTEGAVAITNFQNGNNTVNGSVGRVGPILQHFNRMELVQYDVGQDEPVRGPDGFFVKCGPNEPGLLVAQVDHNPARFEGYYKNPAARQKKIAENCFVKGDCYYMTGDLLKRDEKFWYYFIDRIGDTFRYRGENVATNDVAETLLPFQGLSEINVYGASIPGREGEGRIGMASIVIDKSFSFSAFAKHVCDKLPTYARPYFLRIQEEMQVTGTFKQMKAELRATGIDPTKTTDKIYKLNEKGDNYDLFTKSQFSNIHMAKL